MAEDKEKKKTPAKAAPKTSTASKGAAATAAQVAPKKAAAATAPKESVVAAAPKKKAVPVASKEKVKKPEGKRAAPVKKVAVQKPAQPKEKKSHPPLTPETGVVVEQYTSSIRQPHTQLSQLKSLGLGRIGKSKLLPKIPSVLKLIEKLKHLVRIKK
ncbi:hypothetical protein AGMMS49949_01160 [Alphaproteobacteria bacterium]|nr:hypothetical protein AGMMS49949_01160 [Alphaproteobacteria bacterium]GHS95632.1 hypothetical protein AGMMS50296_0360 [Alphaproteobacteria bacterium]